MALERERKREREREREGGREGEIKRWVREILRSVCMIERER